jgi:hypothetical protein
MENALTKINLNNKTTIKVIKSTKKNNNKINSIKYYSSLLNENKQYIYSFTCNEACNRCFQFLKSYKNHYNRYPDLAINSKIKKIKSEDNVDIYIGYEILDEFKERCLINNIGLLGINNFEYTYVDNLLNTKNIFDLSISAVDLLENEEIDEQLIINNLNVLFYL